MCTHPFQHCLLNVYDVIITSSLTSEVWFIRGGHPHNVVVFQKMSGVKDIGDEQGRVFGQVAKWDVGIAGLLQLVL